MTHYKGAIHSLQLARL